MGGRILLWSFLASLITPELKLKKGCKSSGMMTLAVVSVSGNLIVLALFTRKFGTMYKTHYTFTSIIIKEFVNNDELILNFKYL